jgi:hypothetical protein
MKHFTALLLFALTSGIVAQDQPKLRYWELTKDETLWKSRYNNCQYGYIVLLGEGVVGHAEYPPAPHHGFLIGLPDASSKTEVKVDSSDRFIWVNAEYNVTERSTLSGVTDYQIELASRGREHFKVIRRRRALLQSIPAEWFKVQYDSPRGRVIEEETVALRFDVVYQIGLRSTASSYEVDRGPLEKALAGFRFTKIPKGECSND